ncbi:ribulokinase [Prevotella sp. CAG:604]|nr:ribulokinase [Prevotella sp. CAG:604]
MSAKTIIESGKAILGIEFGSTRIKAVLIDTDNKPIAQGSFEWENQLVDGLWTYSIDTIWLVGGPTASTPFGKACRIATPTSART